MRRIVLMILALGLLVPWLPRIASPAAAQGTPVACAPTPPAANARAVRDWYAAIDAGDIAAFDDVMAPVVVQHAADFANAQGLDEVKANFGPFLAAFSGLHHELEDVVAADDLVAVRVAAHGTQQGEFMGMPATGQDITWTSLAIYRIECGKIAEHWSEVDAVGRLQELGAIPEIVPAAEDEAAPDDMASPTEACAATSAAENTDLVRQRLADGIGDGLGATGAVAHGALARATGTNSTPALMNALRETFPDLQVTADMIFAEGNRVVVRWTATGTQTGAFLAFPATGHTVSFTGNSIVRIACGQVAEVWTEADLLALLQQIGAVTWPPTPAATPDAG
jgi:predicted ester cyclase